MHPNPTTSAAIAAAPSVEALQLIKADLPGPLYGLYPAATTAALVRLRYWK